MKKQYKILAMLLGIIVISCQELDLEPKGILGEPELFGNEFGVKKYFSGIYNDLPIEDFLYFGTDSENAYRPDNYWEQGKKSLGNMSGEFFNSWVGVDNDGFAYWPYGRIRDINTFIQNFAEYKENYKEDVYNELLGEAHFLRAFYYFGLAKRYGGVPIIKEVQSPLDDAETLEVPRNTEYETWKFIYEDLTFAIENMASGSEVGRANKYVAAALLSRTMLYAGSIAKYSQYLGFQGEAATAAGLAGMEASQADEFFQYCVEAGKIVEQGPYTLYTKDYPDKATNFANLFLDPTSSESIFIKDYDMTAPQNTRLRHSYDALMSPQPDMSSFVGAESYPPLDFMELFEMPAYVNADGTPVRFDNRSDIKNGMEPRMLGTMYFDGDELRGSTFSIQKGIYRSFNALAADAENGSSAASINSADNRILGGRGWTTEIDGVTYNITGAHGHFDDQGGENNGWGSAFIRKYVNPDMPTNDVREYRSGQHWVVFRLGEIYLNSAEALYELGQRDEAFNYIEMIRERAGATVTRPAIDMATTNIGTINNANYPYQVENSLQFIRDERARELYGENHWWWDLRRWRTADQVLNQFRHRVLSCYFVADEGKYIYIDEINRWNRSWTASNACYYEPIPWGEIGKNENLLPQNPLY
ncbi:RagB/SusD family nutrient uptake outer membrane protein [Chondrinema litorale]|uniref:RagB/SusD family nutrient uptake outer membrane protein n=1 Tax=Chondrinema litorale TaxID=2994555 RepID=UPI002543C9FF|nr:RagB/SusD family nutrient uptake outer membrane protein [Chondrinema litorale]UZR97453.1 RagB/SusD family nutrient uptake outer membrane protein [Chondrinema litorale]